MNKPELRKYYHQKRLSITVKERSRLDDLLLIRFQQWEVPDFVQTVLSYWPLSDRGEINTFLFTDFLAFRIPALQLAYPVSDFTNNSMRAIAVDDATDYARNKYGIAEPVDGPEIMPESIDLVIVPLLAFDLAGNRLGYGKGFYDRFLAKCSPDAVKLGLCYFEPLPLLPGKDEYDVPLTACITPEKIYEF
ncbi:5-formyltetrahydrofolate cyclo-ligase [Flavihumibacter fluvii]|uniref:5-formyltetrahydrofolate cyclo-ligase n=1 Tax=Flavihumibacter fluvii TaxID=2838157 RepID=UPI001BDE98A0|nr:5-formyltetrahydrofolate cyclo-ligase [Flavihumibacter fluvii]ULQ54200.1 5-formyltetrahydrofolate cyclo-ligase [Flavihumibacter fluvii]